MEQPDRETELTDAHRKILNLELALTSARGIGAAVGILMADQRITYGDAFELLVLASQHDNRKLRDVAEDILRTGDVTGVRPSPT